MPFPGKKEAKGCASGCVGLHRVKGEAMAFDEHFIDFMNRFSTIAGRMARPEWRLELRTSRVLASHPPARQTPGLVRQIRERGLEGVEPSREALGINEAIGRWSGIGGGRARLPQGRHPGIASEEVDARRISRKCSAAQGLEIFPRIEELEGGA